MWYGGISPSQEKRYLDLRLVENFSVNFNQTDSYQTIYNELTEIPFGYTRARLAAMLRYYLRFGDVL